MKHSHQEMDYEIYKKHGRMRSVDEDIPFLLTMDCGTGNR